jgi:hypothetical protein
VRSQVIETNFCKLEVPWNWTHSPGLGGFHEASKRSAVVIENWMEAPTTARAYAETQHDLLKAKRPEIELVEQKEFSSQELGDSYWSAFLLPLPDGSRARQEQLTLVNGFLVCCLTLTARSDDTEAWSEAYPEIYRSLHIVARHWAPGISRDSLIVSDPKTISGETNIIDPVLQIVFPLRPHWLYAPDEAKLSSNSGATITLQRAGPMSGDPSRLFGDSLARKQNDPAVQARRWDKGKNLNGYTFWALEFVAQVKKTWGPAETLITREVFVKDETLLEVRLQARDNDLDALSTFGDLVSRYALLPLSERQHRVQDSWLDLILPGSWIETARGVHSLQAKPPTFLLTKEVNDPKTNLAGFSKAAIRSFKSRPDIKTIVKEERVDGLWKGFEASRYLLDFLNQSSAPMSLRSSWFAAERRLYELVVIGATGEATEDLFRRSLSAVKPPSR